jgi:hypothetical protein
MAHRSLSGSEFFQASRPVLPLVIAGHRSSAAETKRCPLTVILGIAQRPFC